MESFFTKRITLEDLNDSLDRNVDSILMLLDIQSGEVTELKRFDYLIEAPFFRSDDEIMYNSQGRIYSFSIAGKSSRQIDTGYCTLCNNDHVLSPDRTKLAVSHFTVEDYMSRIYIINLEEPEPPFLVTPIAHSYLHGWSPDGSTLSYCALRDGKFDIFSISCQGGKEARLTDCPGKSDGPEYSPDGKYIYFNGVRDGSMDCYRMDKDGSHPVRLTNNGRHNWFPHISPDGKKIVYLSFNRDDVAIDDHPANKQVHLRSINPDGSDDKILLEFFGGQGSINVNSWAPDSRHIAFVTYKLHN